MPCLFPLKVQFAAPSHGKPVRFSTFLLRVHVPRDAPDAGIRSQLNTRPYTARLHKVQRSLVILCLVQLKKILRKNCILNDFLNTSWKGSHITKGFSCPQYLQGNFWIVSPNKPEQQTYIN